VSDEGQTHAHGAGHSHGGGVAAATRDGAQESLNVRGAYLGMGHATLQVEPDTHTGCGEITW